MMNALEQAIKNALDLSGTSREANKAYLEFIKANFMIPIEKTTALQDPEVLFFQENDQSYLPVFSNEESFKNWAHEIAENIAVLRVSGVDLLKNTGENTTICLNLSSPIYKAFNPAELARMRSMVLKFFPDKNAE